MLTLYHYGTDHCVLATALQQTIPPGGVAVCPLGTVQYTCVARSILGWRDLNSATGIVYIELGSKVNDHGIAGVFMTVLTSIRGTTLVSTATIDSVSLQENDVRLSCSDMSGSVSW